MFFYREGFGEGGFPPLSALERGIQTSLNFDSEIANRILGHIRGGNTRSTAAHLCGVAPAQVTAWMTQGLTEDCASSAFALDLERAEAEAEAVMVRALFEAAQDGKWQAAVAWLERARASTWGDAPAPAPEQRAPIAATMTLPEQRAYILRCLAHVNSKLGIVE